MSLFEYEELINKLNENIQIQIKEEKCVVKTKTWYSVEEDTTVLYVKCELSNNKVLVIIPEDELVYVGNVIENMNYERISKDNIKYKNRLFKKTGEGHQFITKVEFGNKEEVEGKCIFEDYESENNIISLGILSYKKNSKVDVYADILSLNDIKIIE